MVEIPLDRPWELAITADQSAQLMAHLFCGDGDEHAAVLLAGLHVSDKCVRLLVRRVILAEEGVDHVSGERGYKMVRAQFMQPLLREARDQNLVFLSVHNHGGRDSVDFSGDDLASHERGYPALLDIVDGPPVGALVYAQEAVAGDFWLPNGKRVKLDWSTILNSGRVIWRPKPLKQNVAVNDRYDRQVRLFGVAGQKILQEAKVAIVGLGGAGSQIAELLGRLGVGQFVLIDPDRADVSNLPRLIAARRSDVLMTEETASRYPRWKTVFDKLRRRKIDLAARNILRANKSVKIEKIFGSIVDQSIAAKLLDVDFIFLAADEMAARLVVNAIVHQYFIPAIQVGARVVSDAESGDVQDVFAVSRPIWPDSGCLWCNGLIDPVKLQLEMTQSRQRAAQAYGTESPAPSVVTLNALAVADAANAFQFYLTGLAANGAHKAYRRYRALRCDVVFEQPRKSETCTECGISATSRFAKGDNMALPTR